MRQTVEPEVESQMVQKNHPQGLRFDVLLRRWTATTIANKTRRSEGLQRSWGIKAMMCDYWKCPPQMALAFNTGSYAMVQIVIRVPLYEFLSLGRGNLCCGSD